MRTELKSAFAVLASTALALAFVACGRADDGDDSRVALNAPVANGNRVLVPGANENAAGDANAAPAAKTIDVILKEFTIEMPSSVAAGPTTFRVKNSGNIDHNFEIEGEGVEKKFDHALEPGASLSLTVDLKPGTYTVYCPVGNHAEGRGMKTNLTVTAQ